MSIKTKTKKIQRDAEELSGYIIFISDWFFFFFFCLSKHIRMEPHYMKLKLNSTITLLITEATEP
jgi:hypothetical protein